MFAKKIFALIEVTDADGAVQRAAASERAGADGVVFCRASGEELVSVVQRSAEELEIPIAAECEGGICEAKELLNAGAEKVILGDAAVRNPGLIAEAASAFGSERVVVAVRAQRKGEGYWEVCTEEGARAERMDAYCWAVAAERLGAGELLLATLRRGGEVVACDADFVKLIAPAVSIPVSALCLTEESRELCALLAGGMAASVVSPTLFGGKTCALSLKRSLSASNFSAGETQPLELRLGA